MTRSFSIRGMLGAVAIVACGCAALAYPSLLWAGILWTGAIATLTIGVVATIYRRDRLRAFWIGFSACGWTYMVLTLAPWCDDHTGELIATRQLLDWLGRMRGHEVPTLGSMPGIWQNIAWADSDSYIHLAFLVSGHSLLAVVAGLAGGWFSSWLWQSNARSDAV